MTLAKVAQPMTQFEMEAEIAGLESRICALELKHNLLVRALENKAVVQEDLAIWWEAYRAAIPPVTHQDTIIDIANDALAAYKAKAAELRGK